LLFDFEPELKVQQVLTQHQKGALLYLRLLPAEPYHWSQAEHDATLSFHVEISHSVFEVEGKLHIRHVAKLIHETQLGSWRYEVLGEQTERQSGCPLWYACLEVPRD
jgi:hypothetical protein